MSYTKIFPNIGYRAIYPPPYRDVSAPRSRHDATQARLAVPVVPIAVDLHMNDARCGFPTIGLPKRMASKISETPAAK